MPAQFSGGYADDLAARVMKRRDQLAEAG